MKTFCLGGKCEKDMSVKFVDRAFGFLEDLGENFTAFSWVAEINQYGTTSAFGGEGIRLSQ